MAASSSSEPFSLDDQILQRLEWILPFVNPDTAHIDKCCKDPLESKFCDGLLKVNRTGSAAGTEINKKQEDNVYTNNTNKESDLVQKTQIDNACKALLQLLIQAYCSFVYCPTGNVTESIQFLSDDTNKVFTFILEFMAQFVGDSNTSNETINKAGMKYMYAFVFVVTKLLLNMFDRQTELYKEETKEYLQSFTYMQDSQFSLQLENIKHLNTIINVDKLIIDTHCLNFREVNDLLQDILTKTDGKWFSNDKDMYSKMYEKSLETNNEFSFDDTDVPRKIHIEQGITSRTKRTTNQRCIEIWNTLVKATAAEKSGWSVNQMTLDYIYVFENKGQTKSRSSYLATALFYVYRFIIISSEQRFKLFINDIGSKTMTFPTQIYTPLTQIREYADGINIISEYITSTINPHTAKNSLILQNSINIMLTDIYLDGIEERYTTNNGDKILSKIDFLNKSLQQFITEKQNVKNDKTLDAKIKKLQDKQKQDAEKQKKIEKEAKVKELELKIQNTKNEIKTQQSELDNYVKKSTTNTTGEENEEKQVIAKRYAAIHHKIHSTGFAEIFSNPIGMFYASARILCDQYHYTELRMNRFFCFVEDWERDGREPMNAYTIKDALNILNTYSPENNQSFSGPLDANMYMLSNKITFNVKNTDEKPNKNDIDYQKKIKEYKEYIDVYAGNTEMKDKCAALGQNENKIFQFNTDKKRYGKDQNDFQFYKVQGNKIQYYSMENPYDEDGYKLVPQGSKNDGAFLHTDYLQPNIPFLTHENDSDTKKVGKRLIRTVEFDKVFNMTHGDYENHFKHAINAMMIETFIRLFTGIVFFTYGGSGTGKTTLLFGKIDPSGSTPDRPGLINVMLSAIPPKHPVQKSNSENEGYIDLSIYEVSWISTNEQKEHSEKIEYYYLPETTSVFDLENNIDGLTTTTYNKCKNCPKQGFYGNAPEEVYCEDHKEGSDIIKSPIIEECPITSVEPLCKAILNIDKKIVEMRKTKGTIRATVNNPVSSRSIIIYEMVITYPMGNDENGKKRTPVTIPIVICDLPGWEYIPEKEKDWINHTILTSLKCQKSLSDPISQDFLKQNRINTKVGLGHKIPRIFSLNILNRRGAHEGKLQCLYGSVLTMYPNYISGNVETHKLFLRNCKPVESAAKLCKEEIFKDGKFNSSKDYTTIYYNDIEKKLQSESLNIRFLPSQFNKTDNKEKRFPVASLQEKVIEAHKQVGFRICHEKDGGDRENPKNLFQFTTWAEFMSLKNRLLRKYFDLQRDQRTMLDNIADTFK